MKDKIRTFLNNSHLFPHMSSTTLDDKGRITIPIEFRKTLELKSGSKVAISIVNNTILIRKSITSDEYTAIAENISFALKKQTSKPISFEKLF